jgi:hypothetical protein
LVIANSAPSINKELEQYIVTSKSGSCVHMGQHVNSWTGG